MAAPTEEEIRATLIRRYHERGSATWGIGSQQASLYIVWEDTPNDWAAVTDGLYEIEDLRESEVERFDALRRDAVKPLFAEFTPRLVEAIVAATMQFAHEHPDAPRAIREPVPA